MSKWGSLRSISQPGTCQKQGSGSEGGPILLTPVPLLKLKLEDYTFPFKNQFPPIRKLSNSSLLQVLPMFFTLQGHEKEEWARHHVLYLCFSRKYTNILVKIIWAGLSFQAHTCLNTNTDPASILFLFSFALSTSHSTEILHVSFAMSHVFMSPSD